MSYYQLDAYFAASKYSIFSSVQRAEFFLNLIMKLKRF